MLFFCFTISRCVQTLNWCYKHQNQTKTAGYPNPAGDDGFFSTLNLQVTSSFILIPLILFLHVSCGSRSSQNQSSSDAEVSISKCCRRNEPKLEWTANDQRADLFQHVYERQRQSLSIFTCYTLLNCVFVVMWEEVHVRPSSSQPKYTNIHLINHSKTHKKWIIQLNYRKKTSENLTFVMFIKCYCRFIHFFLKFQFRY